MNVAKGSDSEDSRNMFMPSPSPEETFSDAEGANSDGEWPMEIVGEQVDQFGKIRYEVKWETWRRADGTNTTWDNSLIPGSVIRSWENIQRQRRLAKAMQPGVRIPTSYDVTDRLTHSRHEAVGEKIKQLGQGVSLWEKISRSRTAQQEYQPLPSPSEREVSVEIVDITQNASYRNVQTPLRKSTRLGTQLSTSSTSTSGATPIYSSSGSCIPSRKSSSPVPGSSSKPSCPDLELVIPPKKRGRPCKQVTELVIPPKKRGRPCKQVTELVIPPKKRGRPCKRMKVEESLQEPKKPTRLYVPRKVKLEGRYSEPVGDFVTPSPPKITSHMKQYSRKEALSQKWTEIAKAAGAAYITFTNEVDDEDLPTLFPGFQYLETGYVYSHDVPKSGELDDELFVKCTCKRCSDPRKCECQSISELEDKRGRKRIAYNLKGLLDIDVTPGLLVIECNKHCSCNLTCHNRISQRPRKIPIDIFKTTNRGWGARPLCSVPKGTVLGMYTGKLMTRKEAEGLGEGERGFCFDLDGQENPYDDEPQHVEAYTVDSRTCGNWTHFVNHSCRPNMQVYQVVHDTIPELNTPSIMFYAAKDIPAQCELTVDYDPGASDDEESTAKRVTRATTTDAKRDIPEGAILCKCGEDICRQRVKVLDLGNDRE